MSFSPYKDNEYNWIVFCNSCLYPKVKKISNGRYTWFKIKFNTLEVGDVALKREQRAFTLNVINLLEVKLATF